MLHCEHARIANDWSHQNAIFRLWVSSLNVAQTPKTVSERWSFEQFCKFARGSEKERKKTKKLSPTKWGMESSGKGSCGIQRPEYQELRAATAAAPFITQKRSETQNVILQIRLGEMITWDMLTIVTNILGSTGPDLWNTCPTRHLKVQISRDTCVGACAAKKHDEFERQTTLSGLLQTTVRMYFVSLLRRYRSW